MTATELKKGASCLNSDQSQLLVLDKRLRQSRLGQKDVANPASSRAWSAGATEGESR